MWLVEGFSDEELQRMQALMPLSDIELLARAREGDEYAIGALYLRHTSRWYWKARSWGLSDMDAEVYVGNVIEKVIAGILSFKFEDARARGWLARLEYNALVDLIRSIRPDLRPPTPVPPVGEDDDYEAALNRAYECAYARITAGEQAELGRKRGPGQPSNAYRAAFEHFVEEFGKCCRSERGGESVA